MYLDTGFALVAADAAVPFRTTIKHVTDYDGPNVATRSTPTSGPRVHRSRFASIAHAVTPPAVLAVLHAHRVLLLQGPAVLRVNWSVRIANTARGKPGADPDTASPNQAHLDRMKTALNERWLRPTLGWWSAAHCWQTRRPIDDDRAQLHDEVQRRAERLRRRHVTSDLAMRLAIEQALTHRGYLRVTSGRRPLCG